MSAETTLIVAVPEAQRVVRWARWRFDPSARRGMPAHVTVLYPFVEPAELDDAVMRRLEEVFASTAPFRFSLKAVGWFGDRVAYLLPEPSGPFLSLTQAVVDRFPGYQPYKGLYEHPVPHLTLGSVGSRARLSRAAQRAAKRLPVEASAREVLLMSHPHRGRWRPVRAFALGSGATGQQAP